MPPCFASAIELEKWRDNGSLAFAPTAARAPAHTSARPLKHAPKPRRPWMRASLGACVRHKALATHTFLTMRRCANTRDRVPAHTCLYSSVQLPALLHAGFTSLFRKT
eukprot:3154401-Pleurochrysis_carterae.AAC.3